jgi:hypothetical protein
MLKPTLHDYEALARITRRDGTPIYPVSGAK